MNAFKHIYKLIDNYLLTESLARPFARRFARILRPVGVFMRTRKP